MLNMQTVIKPMQIAAINFGLSPISVKNTKGSYIKAYPVYENTQESTSNAQGMYDKIGKTMRYSVKPNIPSIPTT